VDSGTSWKRAVGVAALALRRQGATNLATSRRRAPPLQRYTQCELRPLAKTLASRVAVELQCRGERPAAH
jgi:hypothetical protein